MYAKMEELGKLKIIAFTHRDFKLDDVGKLVLAEEERPARLQELKNRFGWSELMMIATCNRVEFIFVSELPALGASNHAAITPESTAEILQFLYPGLDGTEIAQFAEKAATFAGVPALVHLMKVSSSLDSLVVGEKEILLQVRQSYEAARGMGLTGDLLRLVMDRVVKAAKEVYTHTRIAEKPVSVVSVAYRLLKSQKTTPEARILLIGAGQTNKLFSKYLRKHGSTNFTVFNRTLSKAEELAAELGGTALPLEQLTSYNKGFDVIITCTGAAGPIITPAIYQSLLAGENSTKTIVDLALPSDTAEELRTAEGVQFIGMEHLQDIVRRNMNERYLELEAAEAIIDRNVQEFRPVLRQRQIELAMREVPHKIKEIRASALNNVFVEDIQQLDPNSREVLEKVLNYMEKRYVSVPMVMAKDILLSKSNY